MALGGVVAGSARVIVGADTRDLDKGMRDSERSFVGTMGRMRGAAVGVGGVIAGVLGGSLAVALKSSVAAASNLEEQINKTSTVFRGSEQDILRWSETTAAGFGISQRAALEAAGTFGNMLVPMGFARDRAGEMSKAMVELAADMASFNNASPEETLLAIRSGLAGETEPLRRFGVFLNEARIQAEALDSGLIKQGQTLTAAGKAAATYQIILKDTSDTQGDFGRTSDSLANQTRILRAQIEEVQAEIGQKLMPVLLDLLTFVNERLIPGVQQFANDWDRSWRDVQKTALLAYRKIVEPMSHLPWEFGEGAREIKEAVNEELAKLSAKKGIDRITDQFENWDVTAAQDAGSRVGAAWRAGFLGSATPALDALTGEKTPPFGPGSVTSQQSRRPANVVLAGGADRPGVATKNIVLQFVSRLGQIAGQDRVVIGTGTRHSQFTTSGNQSQHWTGNAADVPATGAALTRLGQSALIAAGADPAWARRQKGGLYNIGGFQIIFNSNIGGNHFNHLHVGVRDGTEIPGAPAGNEEPPSKSEDTKYAIDKPTATTTAGDIVPPKLRLALARAEVAAGNADDLRALSDIEAYLEQRVAKEKNVEKRIKLLQELSSIRGRITAIREGGAAPTPTAADLIPPRLRLSVAEAELTKTTADDLRALRNVEDYLEKRLKGEKDVNDRLELVTELKSVRDRIAALAPEEEEQPLIPKALQLRLAQAEVTKQTADDLAALDAIIVYLEGRLAREKDINKRLEILRDLRSYRERVAAEVGPSRAAGTFGETVEELIGAPPREDRGPARPLGEALPAVSAREQEEINKILASGQPQLAKWAAYARELIAKRKAAQKLLAQARKALQTALKRPARMRKPSLIAQIRADIAAYEEDIRQLTEAIDDAIARYGELEAVLQSDILEAAGEDERAAETAPRDTGAPTAAGGDVGGGSGGGFGGGDTGGGGGGAPAPALITPEQTAAMRAEILGAKSGFFREFSPNVFHGPPGLLELGSIAPVPAKAPVIVNQYFQTPPPDQHSYFLAAQFSAEHALG